MRKIEKKRQNEPTTLKAYRETTPNATYNGFTDTDQMLKKALLEEQGHLCAYCNGRISLKLNADYKRRIEVEHFLSQDEHPQHDLDYENMLGVCNGVTIEKNEHCDKSKKTQQLQQLDPRRSSIEVLLGYTLKGNIESKKADNIIEADIQLLNLNDSFLVNSRKQAMDEALRELQRQYPTKQWTKHLFDKEIEKWQSKHKSKYRPYCNAAVWFLALLKQKGKYPAK